MKEKKKFKKKLTVAEKLAKIESFKLHKDKSYIPPHEQIGNLKKMNFEIDIDEELAIEHLEEENYLQFFKSYEDDYIVLNHEDSVKELKINKDSTVKDIIKHLKPKNWV